MKRNFNKTTIPGLILIITLLSACGQQSANNSHTSDSTFTDTSTRPIIDSSQTAPNPTDNIQYITDKVDSVTLINFWNSIVVPILKRDKKTVMTTIQFPLYGDWTEMIGLNKTPETATAKDFLIIYNKLFNKNFIALLSSQTYKDVEVMSINNTLYFSFGVSKKEGEIESSVRLNYTQTQDKFTLDLISGSGGNFYKL